MGTRRPPWFLGAAVGANLIVMYLFVAYWEPRLRAPLGVVAPVAFLAAVAWELFQAIEDVRQLRSDPELTERQRRVVAGGAAIALALVGLPAFVVAGLSAFSA